MSKFQPIRTLLLATASLAAAALAAAPARAVITDPAGDFLSVYVGPRNGDLDVLSVDAFRSAPNPVVLVGPLAAAIGTTPGAVYVWGIDRGVGTALFTTFNPPTGQGVIFDSAVGLFPDGTGFFLDFALGGGPRPLDSSTISISGPTITVTLPESLLLSQGLAFADYRYNLWPRFAPNGIDVADNALISDFAPDASTFTARAFVPEPASLALLAGGVMALAALRRRSPPSPDQA